MSIHEYRWDKTTVQRVLSPPAPCSCRSVLLLRVVVIFYFAVVNLDNGRRMTRKNLCYAYIHERKNNDHPPNPGPLACVTARSRQQ
eukprot:5862381-Pleurochrysis_carterae.AAC.1